MAKALERAAGRRRALRHGPRPLDVDLLLHGELVRSGPELSLPHPSLARRRFYLQPLAEIAAELPVPPGGDSVGDLLAALGGEQRVEEVGWSRPPPGREPALRLLPWRGE